MLLALLAIAGAGVAGVTLAATDYLGVTPPTVHKAPAVIQTCAACHGPDGIATAPTFPNLAGQNYNYLLKALEAFRSGAWNTTPMKELVATIPTAGKNRNLKQVAAYFSQHPLDYAKRAAGAKPAKAVAEAGYKLYFQGNRKTHVPACAACHLASGMGDAPMAVPRLAGQNAQYLVSQLKAFASGARQTSPDHVMGKIAGRLSDKEIQAVASYLHVMRPDLLPGRGPKNYAAYDKAVAQQPVPGVPASALAKAPHK